MVGLIPVATGRECVVGTAPVLALRVPVCRKLWTCYSRVAALRLRFWRGRWWGPRVGNGLHVWSDERSRPHSSDLALNLGKSTDDCVSEGTRSKLVLTLFSELEKKKEIKFVFWVFFQLLHVLKMSPIQRKIIIKRFEIFTYVSSQ